MMVWRLARRDRTDLGGEGARLYGGRWNTPGTAVIYTAGTLSLAVLEYLDHVNPDKIPDDLVSIAGEIPNALAIDHLAIDTLPPNWNDLTLEPVTQSMGTQWVIVGHSAVLRVPSVVIPQESNYVLNPRHPDFAAITWSVPEPFSAHYSRRFVAKSRSRQARQARGAVRKGGILEIVCRPTERRARLPGRSRIVSRLIVAANPRLQQKCS